MCGAAIGYLAGPAARWTRLLLFVTATLFFIPSVIYDATAAVLLVAIIAAQLMRGRRGAPANSSSPDTGEKVQG
jgi:TRAP-type uncharacterized transport system fused permease subunit